MKSSFDVVIVGAGAAGIACAERLAACGQDFLLIEAKARVGGRVQTQVTSHLPLELGAEFIHGAPAATLDWMNRFGLFFYDVGDFHLFKKNDSHTEIAEYWSRIENILKKFSAFKKSDISVQEFLRRKKLRGERLSLFRAFVEGFHAADLNVIGAKELAATEDSGDETLNGVKSFRCLQPYQLLLESIFRTFASEKNFYAQTVLRRVRRQPGQILLKCHQPLFNRDIQIRCKRIVLTAPAGVLKNGSIEWDPMPPQLTTALDAIEMGHVQKLTFEFAERFWEKLSPKPISFLHHTTETYFPTWWTHHPLRTPYLVAWQGGPKAQMLATMQPKAITEIALSSLSDLTNKPLRFVRSRVKDVFTHNWSKDPFVQGAYSYLSVGGLKQLKDCEVIDDSIYLAGEAFAKGSSRGTVHGALESGVMAAENILRSKEHRENKQQSKGHEPHGISLEIH